MTNSRRIRAVLRWVGISALVLVIILVALFGLLQTAPVKRYVAHRVAAAIGGPLNSRLRYENFRGPLPQAMFLDRVVLEDPHGVWLVIENLHLDWSPFALLRRRVIVHEASAGRVRFVRLPDRDRPPRVPQLPEKAPNLTVEVLRVDALAFGEPGAPQETQLSVRGDIQYVRAVDGLRADLQIREIAGPPATGAVRVMLETSPSPSLALDIRYDEAQTGPLGQWLGEPAGPASLRLTGSGPLGAWAGDILVQASSRPVVQGLVRLSEPDPADGVGMKLEGTVNMPPSVVPANLQPILGIENRFVVQAQLAQDQQVTVDQAAITSLLGRLNTSGNIDFKTGAIDIKFNTDIQDLAAVKELIGLGIEGQASAEGTVTGQLKQPQVALTINGENLQFGEASAQSLTGQLRMETLEPWEQRLPRARFSGEGMLTSFLYRKTPFLPEGTFDWRLVGQTSPDGQITLEKLVLFNPAVSLTFTGGYNIESKEATFDMQFSSEEIEPTARAVGLEAKGAATLSVRGTGSISDFDVVAEVEGRGLTVGGAPVEILTARAEFSGLPRAPTGNVRVVADWQGSEISAQADLKMEAPSLRITDLALAAPATEVTGALTANLETGLLEGAFQGHSEDLAALGDALNEPLGGSFNFDLALAAEEGRQGLTLDLSASQLQTPWAAAETLTISADLQNVRESPAGSALIASTGLQTGELTVAELEARYEGSNDEGSLTGQARGALGEPFALELAGGWEREEEGAVVTLSKLSGAWAQYPVRLAQPAELRMTPERSTLSNAQLMIGPGSVLADAALVSDNLDVRLVVDGLPLEVIKGAGGPAISGTAQGTLTISGPLGAPVAQVNLQVASLGALPPSADAPPVDLDLAAQYEAGLLAGTLSVTRLFEDSVEGTFSVPLVLSLAPAEFRLPRNEPVQARLDFSGTLDRITALFPLDDQRLSGNFQGGLALTGTLADPSLEGALEVVNGSYDHLEYGTIARNLNARLVAEGPLVRIISLSATDGSNGRIQAEGELLVELDDMVPIDIDVTLDDFRLVRREDVRATASGPLTIEGNLSFMEVAGSLIVNPFSVSLQEFRASPVMALEVQDINVPPRLEESVAAVTPPPPEQDGEIPQFFQRIVLNIDLNLPGPATISGYGMESVWQGDVQVRGTAAAPILIGQLRAVRGEMAFAGRPFRLQEGTITLRGASPPDPLLDVTAEQRARDVTALVRITGSASNLELSLESTPPLPRDEILARVLFGRDATRISPVQALQLAATANTLATGRRGFGLLGQVGRALGLEGLTLQEAGEEGGDIGLGFSRYLGENVYLNVSQGFGAPTGEAGIEVELNRFLTLESTISPEGGTGVSVNWKKDY